MMIHIYTCIFLQTVPATHTTHSLIFLEMYTNYSISILAFNPAGDGPRAEWTTVKTLEGLPGKPSNLRFTEITMNTLKVEWDDPLKPNGEIVGYLVTYETSEQDESESKEMWKNCFATIFIFICHLYRCK